VSGLLYEEKKRFFVVFIRDRATRGEHSARMNAGFAVTRR